MKVLSMSVMAHFMPDGPSVLMDPLRAGRTPPMLERARPHRYLVEWGLSVRGLSKIVPLKKQKKSARLAFSFDSC